MSTPEGSPHHAEPAAAVTKEVWASGQAYEPWIARWSRLIAAEFLDWLAVPAGARWLDVGCGTGALTQTILRRAAPARVKGVDRTEGYIAYAGAQIRDERVEFEVGDALTLPAASGEFDAAVSGLVLNFLPQPGAAVSEMARAVQSGGAVGAYVWDYAGRMQMLRYFWNAASALDPAARDLDQGRRFPLCQPGPLAILFQGAGLVDVAVRPIDIPMDFRDFDDYWLPFLGGEGAAPTYLARLSEEQRVALRERLRTVLPFALDGSLPLVARTWAVRGTRR